MQKIMFITQTLAEKNVPLPIDAPQEKSHDADIHCLECLILHWD